MSARAHSLGDIGIRSLGGIFYTCRSLNPTRRSTLALHTNVPHYYYYGHVSFCYRQFWVTHWAWSSFPEGLPVEVVFTVTRANPLQVGDVSAQFLDGGHLLVEELALDKVGHLEGNTRCGQLELVQVWLTYVEVAVPIGNLVEIEQGLVDGLLQLKGCLHGVQPTAPLVLGRLLYVLKHNATAAVVLELHERLGVLFLLVGGLAEELGKTLQIHVVTLKVGGL